MSTELKWPSADDIVHAALEAADGTPTLRMVAEIASSLHRKAWLTANDDPSADLPGTVRISPDGTVVTRSGMDDGVPWLWLNLSKLETGDTPWWFTNTDVVGWTHGTPVEGTPAAKAADQ